MSFKDKEKYIEYQKQYHLDNKEKRKPYLKQYYLDNKEKIKEANKQYNLDNKENISKRTKQYNLDNKEKYIEYQKQYNLDNKEKRKEYIKQYTKERCKSEPLFKFKITCRKRANHAFKRKSWIKNGGTEKLLGCDWKTAMNHIEKQFESWMNWDNHGKWHIDHIIPLASANTIEEMTPLFNYKNLQPLLAEDNIRKGDKIIVK